jgi:NADH:ubiquinone oxidoreductase subunit E
MIKNSRLFWLLCAKCSMRTAAISPPNLMDAVADYLAMPPIAVYEVASFYSMFETKPVGRNHIAVCTNISCMLRGSDTVLTYIERKLGIKLGWQHPGWQVLS